MKIVIDVPEKVYNRFCRCNRFPDEVEEAIVAITDGTPLPKGHGRIGDLDKFIQTMKERNNDNGGEPLNAVDRGYDLACQHMVKEAEECVIIEADNAERSEE